MKRRLCLFAILSSLAVSGPGYAQGPVFSTPGQHEIVARVTGSDCRREYPVFQISGTPARGFVVNGLAAGSSCGTNRHLGY